jgi:hypothetical protein
MATKAKCRHLKNYKGLFGTRFLQFIDCMEIKSVMLAFFTQLCELFWAQTDKHLPLGPFSVNFFK